MAPPPAPLWSGVGLDLEHPTAISTSAAHTAVKRTVLRI